PRDGPAFRTVLSEEIVQADVGRISLTRENGEPETAYFLNTCHVGIGGEVAVQVSHSSKVLGGFASFLFGTLRALAIYKDKRMRLNIDGVESEQIVKELIIAKGQYDGGGMHVAPHARLDNGLFDIYVIGEVSFPDAIMSLPKLYRGRLDLRPDIVTYYQARSISVNCDEKVYVSPHGELPGILPAHFDILPQSLRVVRRA
ncbi:MAG: hypothetical protein HYV26_08390, partial [Candidatus Hydrogenedentes bacterium]|nr:hypothetical protein [Candidatus Hydrogenedentota bacterium]